MVNARRILAMLAAALLMMAALGGVAAAEPPTPPPTPTPTPSAPSTTTTTPPDVAGATVTGTAPSSDDDSCPGFVVPVLDVCSPNAAGILSSASPTNIVKDASLGILGTMVDWVLAGFVWIMKYVLQLFMGVSVDVSGTQTAVQKMSDLTGDLQTIALGLGLLVALITVLYQRAMLSGDNAAPEAVGGLIRWAVAATMAAPILIALSGVSDALASWIFTSAAGPEGPTHVVDALASALSGRDAKLNTEEVISLALCILGLLAYLELMIQLVLQKFWIIYAVVALPIAGASSVIGGGKTVFWALVRAAIAALLFKPVAAIAFGVAFLQIRSLESGADVMAAVTLMVAPAFILPLLINMIGTNVAYSGTPMLRGTIRGGRAALSAGAKATRTAGQGARTGSAAAGAGAGAAGRGLAKAVPFVGGMGRAAAQTLTGPPPSRTSGGGGRASGPSGGAAVAPGRGSSSSSGSRGSGANNYYSSSTRSGGSGSGAAGTGSRTANSGAVPANTRPGRASSSSAAPGAAPNPPARPASRSAATSDSGASGADSGRGGATNGGRGSGAGEHTPRPGRRSASSSSPNDSSFNRIT